MYRPCKTWTVTVSMRLRKTSAAKVIWKTPVLSYMPTAISYAATVSTVAYCVPHSPRHTTTTIKGLHLHKRDGYLIFCMSACFERESMELCKHARRGAMIFGDRIFLLLLRAQIGNGMHTSISELFFKWLAHGGRIGARWEWAFFAVN